MIGDGLQLMDTFKLKVTLLEDMLGTIPKDREVLTSYVHDLARKKHPEETNIGAEDEIGPETPEDVDVRASTGFYQDEQGRPVLKDYQVKRAVLPCAGAGLWGVARVSQGWA